MRTGRTSGLLVAVALAAGIPAATAWAQVVPCEAPVRVTEALRTVPPAEGNAEADRSARVAALRALLKRFPADVYVHQRYQDAAGQPTAAERDALIAEYHALAEKHPNDNLYFYLDARAQVGSNTKHVLPRLEAVAPAVPPAHLSLVRIYQAPAFKDQKKALEHLEAYTKACPTSVAAYDYFDSLEPSDFVRQGVVTLRKVLRQRTDPESLASYSTLWSLEFRLAPPARHEELRKLVAEDLKRLRTIAVAKTSAYYTMLAEGYELTGDAAGRKWANEQAGNISPRLAMYGVIGEWYKQHPAPTPGDSRGKRAVFNEAYAKATAEWSRRWPDSSYVGYMRVNALRDSDSASAAEVEAAGENLLRAAAKNPGEMTFFSTHGGSSFALLVADLYARKRVRTERLTGLVRQGLAELDTPRRRMESDLYPRSGGDPNRDFVEWYGALTIADIWLNAKDTGRAPEAIARLQGIAERSRPDPGEKDAAVLSRQRKTFLSRQSDYFQRMGDLALLEGRRVDAMTFYQNALLSRTGRGEEAADDSLDSKARTLWKDIGGTEVAWQAWSSRRELLGGAPAAVEAAGSWTSIEKKLPEFDLTDLSGAKWQLSNLKGKMTLINVWAST